MRRVRKSECGVDGRKVKRKTRDPVYTYVRAGDKFPIHDAADCACTAGRVPPPKYFPLSSRRAYGKSLVSAFPVVVVLIFRVRGDERGKNDDAIRTE